MKTLENFFSDVCSDPNTVWIKPQKPSIDPIKESICETKPAGCDNPTFEKFIECAIANLIKCLEEDLTKKENNL